MLDEILQYCRRLRTDDDEFVSAVFTGTYRVENGGVTPHVSGFPIELEPGEYFCIIGSRFNDGVHRYPDEELQPELFTGTVLALALPPAFLRLVSDMEDWQAKNGDKASGVYQSESFGGWSGTKAADKNGGAVTVWSVFAGRLAQWRKI